MILIIGRVLVGYWMLIMTLITLRGVMVSSIKPTHIMRSQRNTGGVLPPLSIKDQPIKRVIQMSLRVSPNRLIVVDRNLICAENLEQRLDLRHPCLLMAITRLMETHTTLGHMTALLRCREIRPRIPHQC